jgi:hypothetical protein
MINIITYISSSSSHQQRGENKNLTVGTSVNQTTTNLNNQVVSTVQPTFNNLQIIRKLKNIPNTCHHLHLIKMVEKITI